MALPFRRSANLVGETAREWFPCWHAVGGRFAHSWQWDARGQGRNGSSTPSLVAVKSKVLPSYYLSCPRGFKPEWDEPTMFMIGWGERTVLMGWTTHNEHDKMRGKDNGRPC